MQIISSFNPGTQGASPIYHFLPSGNYISCNQYWALGMACPHHEADDIIEAGVRFICDTSLGGE